MKLRDELSMKVNILAPSLETCVHEVVKGNKLLQPVVEVALSILDNIEELEESIRNQDGNYVRQLLSKILLILESC